MYRGVGITILPKEILHEGLEWKPDKSSIRAVSLFHLPFVIDGSPKAPLQKHWALQFKNHYYRAVSGLVRLERRA